MGKVSFTVMALVMWLLSTACPADPTPVTVTNADGRAVTLVLHGDEHSSYLTTVDGYLLQQDSRGGYVYVRLVGSNLIATSVLAHDASSRDGTERKFLSNVARSATTEGHTTEHAAHKQHKVRTGYTSPTGFDLATFRGIVILVEFSDRKFSRSDARDFFDRMFNEPNYTGFVNEDGTENPYGTFTGSVRDYFYDNSHGIFEPHWDVFGPYDTDMSCLQGRKEYNAIHNKALALANADIDFSQYDGNGDGIIDGIFFLYAGHASNLGGNNSNYLWPCASFPGQVGTMFDGVRRGAWACSTEKYSSESSGGILGDFGAICHEFSHNLGLLDLYSGDNGTYYWDIMSHGSLNNRTRTPAAYSLQQRREIFDVEVPVLQPNDYGEYELAALPLNSDGYIIPSTKNGEIFLLENRQQTTKWDAALPGHGLFIYRMTNSLTASNYEMLRAGGISTNWGTNPYPGTKNVTSINGVDRAYPNLRTSDNEPNYVQICDINERNGVISFRLDSLDYGGLTVNGTRISDNAALAAVCDEMRASGKLIAGSLDYDAASKTMVMRGAQIEVADNEETTPVIGYTGNCVDDVLTIVNKGNSRIDGRHTVLAVDEASVVLCGTDTLMFNSSDGVAVQLHDSQLENKGLLNIVACGNNGGIVGENSSMTWHDIEGSTSSTLRAYASAGDIVALHKVELKGDYDVTEPVDATIVGGVVCHADGAAVTGEWVTIERTRLPLAILGEALHVHHDTTYWKYYTFALKIVGKLKRGRVAYDHLNKTLTLDNTWFVLPADDTVTVIANGGLDAKVGYERQGMAMKLLLKGENVIEADGVALSSFGGEIDICGEGELIIPNANAAPPVILNAGATMTIDGNIAINTSSAQGGINGDGTPAINIVGGSLEITTSTVPFVGIKEINLGEGIDLTRPYGARLGDDSEGFVIVVNGDGTPAEAGFYRFSQDTILLGDANGDGKVNVTDIVAISNYVLCNPESVIVFDNADVNEDGKVNITDLVGVASLLLNE